MNTQQEQPTAVITKSVFQLAGWSRYLNASLVVAVLALILAAWQWQDSRQRINNIEQNLVKRLTEFESANKESRLLSAQAQEGSREALVKLGVLESKLIDSQNQQVALEALYQELSRNRDEWVLADIEQILSIASQQLQLSGNVKAALIAMQTADSRLQRLDKPQFIGLRKVINKDIERLKALPFVDTVGISLRLDEMIATIDNLPLMLSSPPKDEKTAPKTKTSGGWWSQLRREAWQDVTQLVQIRRIDHPEVPLMTPSQTYYVRENTTLRLLTARIALFQPDEASFKADLKSAQAWVERYFDSHAKLTRATQSTLQQIASSTVNIQLPDISDSLTAINQYKLAHERNPR